MIDDPVLRDALNAYLRDEPPMRLTPETVVRSGRRGRAIRQTATAAFSALTVAVIALGFHAAATRNITQPATPGVTSTTGVAPTESSEPVSGIGGDPGYVEPVPNLLANVVRLTLPKSPLYLKNIYANDWRQSTPLSPQDVENATNWHAVYQLGPNAWHELRVTLSVNPPEATSTAAKARRTCKGVKPVCLISPGQRGTHLVVQVMPTGPGTWTRTVVHHMYGDRSAVAREQVQASSLAQANKRFAIPLARLKQLATDPRLVVPDPKVTPPLPR
ncbi:hypothetical protein [Kribbella deserti]|uniref:Uncharacterized protein n=1 Tax=Kribbella deserti TaxID=1926257 RepID=A0ABV6QMX8_9ACTN